MDLSADRRLKKKSRKLINCINIQCKLSNGNDDWKLEFLFSLIVYAVNYTIFMKVLILNKVRLTEKARTFQGLTSKDQDEDKDQTHKDQDKDQD